MCRCALRTFNCAPVAVKLLQPLYKEAMLVLCPALSRLFVLVTSIALITTIYTV